MSKKQKDHFNYSPLIIYIFLIFTLIASSLTFVPAISTLTLPFTREKLFREFVNEIKNIDYLNAQTYWKFREFYSPGSLIFSKRGISSDLISNTLAIINIPISLSTMHNAFLVYKSPKLVSIDFLVEEHDLSQIINDELNSKTILYSNSNTVLYQENNFYKLIFLKPQQEMKRTVGFFDYDKADREFTDKKYWLNLTRIEK